MWTLSGFKKIKIKNNHLIYTNLNFYRQIYVGQLKKI